MTVLKIFLICFIFGAASPTSAKIKVHTGVNVYKHTLSTWKTAANNTSFDSISWVWNLGTPDRKHRNGSRDSILMVPDSAIPDDITLVVWFHGLGGFGKGTFEKRIIPQIESIVEDGHSVAVAIPEMPWSVNTSTPRKRQGQIWKRPGELERYITSVKGHLRAWALNAHGVELGSVRIIFVGHSAGGSALMSAAKEGGICRLQPEAIVWSDASYGYWLDYAWKGCIKDSGTALHILVRKWDKPHKNAQRLIKRIKRSKFSSMTDVRYQVLNRKYWTHGRIGNNVFKITDLFPPGC